MKGERRDKRKRSFLIWQCRVASYFRDSKDNPRWEHATLSSVKNSIKRENPKNIPPFICTFRNVVLYLQCTIILIH
ncbi:MAG: hypothetical protein EGP87_13375 [Paraprevotella clara]|nr:hypothetical protein [Paraprevotella clara]